MGDINLDTEVKRSADSRSGARSNLQSYLELLSAVSGQLSKPLALCDEAGLVVWSNAAWGRSRRLYDSASYTDWLECELVEGQHSVRFGRNFDTGQLLIHALHFEQRPVWLLIFIADLSPQLVKDRVRQDSLARLAGGAAHNFNNVLTTILGQVDYLISQPDLSGSARQELDVIVDAAEVAARICRQLTRFSMHDGVSDEVVELNGLLTQMDQLVRIVVGSGTEIEWAVPDAPIVLVADEASVQQVLLNLVINAAEAFDTNDGCGKIRLSAGAGQLTPESNYEQMLFGIDKSAQFGWFEVADNGPGVATDDLAALFQAGYSTKGDGRGLGLASLADIVRKLGGNVAVTSSAAGSAFKVFFPVHHDSAGV